MTARYNEGCSGDRKRRRRRRCTGRVLNTNAWEDEANACARVKTDEIISTRTLSVSLVPTCRRSSAFDITRAVPTTIIPRERQDLLLVLRVVTLVRPLYARA